LPSETPNPIIELFKQVLAMAQANDWLSGEHFSVDGTLIQAWVGQKSFSAKDGGNDDGANFKGKSRSNGTQASSTDTDARLYRKGNTASELRYMGHTLSDNRHGLVANPMVTIADGHAEREAAKVMINEAKQPAHPQAQITLGADKGYDAAEFIETLTAVKVLPLRNQRRKIALSHVSTLDSDGSISATC
jgi:IS5 family transposase